MQGKRSDLGHFGLVRKIGTGFAIILNISSVEHDLKRVGMGGCRFQEHVKHG